MRVRRLMDQKKGSAITRFRALNGLEHRGTFVAFLFPLLLLTTLGLPFASALATTSHAPDPDTTCSSPLAASYAAVNSNVARTNAESSAYYSEGITGFYNPTFNSVFEIAETVVPYPTCTVEVESVNVVFALHNSTGGWAEYLVITENPSLASIGSTTQTQAMYSTNTYENWAGYEVSGNSQASWTVEYAYSYWTQPTPTYPTSGGCGSAGVCNVDTWVGLEDAHGATNSQLDQDGIWANCTPSGTTCTDSYTAWYESLIAGGLIQCTPSTGGSVAVNGGDTIYAQTVNDAYNGGSSSTYDFEVTDTTDSPAQSCIASITGDTGMTAPIYGDFMTETGETTVNGYYEPLAGFSTDGFYFASMYVQQIGSFSHIDTLYPYGSNMENYCPTGVLNVGVGSLSSSGTFTNTYYSNQYTSRAYAPPTC